MADWLESTCQSVPVPSMHEEQTAVCGGENGCGEAWGPDTITLLGAHVKWEQRQREQARHQKTGVA